MLASSLLKAAPFSQKITVGSAFRSGCACLLIAAVSTASSSSCIAQISLPKGGVRAHRQLDSAPLRVLTLMADAYARMGSVEINSVYTAPEKIKQPAEGPAPAPATSGVTPPATAAAQNPLPPPVNLTDAAATGDDVKTRRTYRVVHLTYATPNLLTVTDKAPDENDPTRFAQWVCDGKLFSAFVPHAHGSEDLLYTQEKAPRSIRQFPNLQYLSSSGIELVMMMGVNPFSNLNAETVDLSMDPPKVIRQVPTEVVVMSSVARRQLTTLHMYIGKADHLLYRLETDVTPLDKSGSVRIGDAIDEQDPTYSVDDNQTPVGSDPDHPLEANDIATSVRQGNVNIHLQYDNFYVPVTHVEREAFKFTPPSSQIGPVTRVARLFTAAGQETAMDPNARRLADLIRRSRKNHSKPVKDIKPIHEIAP